MNIPKHIKAILDRFIDSGFDAYVVGGSLRDAMLGKDAYDFDVASSATPEETMRLFADMRVVPTGIKHGTVTVISEGESVEITTFRTDGEYKDSRRPTSVSFAKTIEDDLSRRDFTINAMAYNDQRGLIDLFGGREDLSAKKIRSVGDPEKRFLEDALRIMRAYRFASQLDFDIDEATLSASHSMKDGLKNIAKERIGNEFLKLLSGTAPHKSLAKMEEILDIILPVTLDTQRFAPLPHIECDAIVRLAFLMNGCSDNDIFIASHSLKLSSKQTQKLKLLSIKIDEKELEAFGEIGARRLIAQYGDEAESALSLHSALYGCNTKNIEILKNEIEKNPSVSLQDLKINGSDLINNGIASGKDVGELLSRLLDLVIEDQSLNNKETLLNFARKMK